MIMLPDGEGWGVHVSHQWDGQAAQAYTRLPTEIIPTSKNYSWPLPSPGRGPTVDSATGN